MAAFELLPGLPPYGPAAKPFPVSGYRAHSQGLVVQFVSEKVGKWVGNFQPGLTNFSGAYEHPDGRHVVVVSGGDTYVVDPDTQTAEDFRGMVESVTPVPEKNALLFAEGIYLSLIGPRGRWRTKRLSWDGIRNLSVAGDFATGEGWRYDETWHKFMVSLDTGALNGGAYDGPEP